MLTCMSTSRSNYFVDRSIWKKHADHSTTLVVCPKTGTKSVSYPKIVKNTPILIQQSIACLRCVHLKALMPITFSPPGSTRSSVFFGFKWKPIIILTANLKFHLQTPCRFGDMAENVKLIGIPINNFLCIYIIASSLGLHTLFLPLESKQEVTSGWNLTKYISEVKVNQLEV